eukprot:CAMPEP_0194771906 /NCGR_PEP_ID=MMETSP0323_2-20130528/50463_1 /TAXON_ID=2866 ORGANISM="Crypthecodinium cohnii, Strain Seligo" /NCGR_SAMPLE_ID=MMETSP0323_2 /ASSEMBLY_ACC=CAM_ASM_000346 /LENGTH=185 /DNA_ID=CAMNT_0039706217 /DNA_START=198 /DNA_END=755 /DNA_ORIENTATION=+
MINRSSFPLQDLLDQARRQDVFHIVVQVRVFDQTSSRPADVRSPFWKHCLRNLTQRYSRGRRSILTIVSNGDLPAVEAYRYFRMLGQQKYVFADIWTHKLEGYRHIDNSYGSLVDPGLLASARVHGIIDWLLMVHADVLVLDRTSGFPVSAALAAAPEQKQFGIFNCKRRPRAGPKPKLCASRYC